MVDDSATDRKILIMPWDDTVQILFKQKEGTVLLNRWQLIVQQMNPAHPITNISELLNIIKSYNVTFTTDGRQEECAYKFLGLRAFFESMTETDRIQCFGTINYIRSLVLQLRQHLPKLYWLQSGAEYNLNLHQVQVACILANAFFCTFPFRPFWLPSINFNNLYEKNDSQRIEKIKCIIHYFERIREQEPYGQISYHRLVVDENRFPRWNTITKPLKRMKVKCKTGIEDLSNHIQVDFANRKIGGGVLGRGCVQEEIRFVICPELIAARLFTEPFLENEAMVIIGAERFCNYTGYADSFKFAGSCFDETPLDDKGRKNTHIVAINATCFRNPDEQYREGFILKEIKKAYAGFQKREDEEFLRPVATGNWGCGVYKGNPQLKSLIQLMACSEVGREMVYCTFGDLDLKEQLQRISGFLYDNQVTVGKLYRICCRYLKDRIGGQTVHDFIFTAISNENFENGPDVSKMGISKPEEESKVCKEKDMDTLSCYFSNSLNNTNKDLNKVCQDESKSDIRSSSPSLFSSPPQDQDDLQDDDIISGTPYYKQPSSSKKLKQTQINQFFKK